MQIKIFSIPIVGGEAFEEEMNRFLRGQKVIHVREELVNNSQGTYWTFYIRYLEKNERQSDSPMSRPIGIKKDYKTILSETDFSFGLQPRNRNPNVETIIKNKQLH